MEKNIVITIARQYGSGGRTIAQMLSERLGIHYYDKELLKLASEDSGINEDLFRNADEHVKTTQLFKIAHSVYKGELIPPESDDFTSMENLFNYQAKIIKKLAEQDESCIIVGRCAEYVLKDYDNVLSVFIHAPHEYCMEQAAKKQSWDPRNWSVISRRSTSIVPIITSTIPVWTGRMPGTMICASTAPSSASNAAYRRLCLILM